MNNYNPRIMLISVSPESAIGGISTWTKGFLSYCNEKKISCRLVDISKINNVQHGGVIKEIQRTLRIFKDLKRTLVTETFDVVHLNTSIGFYGVIRDYHIAKYIKRYRIPIVVHFHCDIPFWDKGRIINKYLSRLFKFSDMNCVLCTSSKKYLRERYNRSSELIPNYVDFTIADKPKEIRKSIKKIIYTGRVSINKGSPEILDIATRFPQITFILVGKVLKEMDSYIKPNNVIFTGQKEHNELLVLLEESDVFLFPSHSEGFSMALTEAMAKGLPCVVTDVGANIDMISDGGGKVVPIESVDAIEAAIKSIESYDARVSMSNESIKKVLNNYTQEDVMMKILQLYTKVYKNE